MTDAAHTPDPELTAEERDLGMDRDITRRDFLNTVALGTGAALLGTAAPGFAGKLAAQTATPLAAHAAADPAPPWHPFTGYSGIGDYARSNGNTWDVVSAGHGIRDDTYRKAMASAPDTGEVYDVIIAGGGFAGTIAAYTVLKGSDRKKSVLLLDNHPIIGGEAKRNEFVVRGQRLIGPQGSNEGGVPREGWLRDMWIDIGLPLEFEYGKLPPTRKSMVFPRTNYQYQLWSDDFESHGFFYDTPSPHWVRNPWGHDLEGTPYPEDVKRDLLRWRNERVEPWKGDAESLKLWLDTMTYEQYLTNVRKLHPEVSRYVDPIYASGIGLGADVLSAYSAYSVSLPGFVGLGVDKNREQFTSSHTMTDARLGNSFPGGNDGIQRCIVKWLNPEAIEGTAEFTQVHNNRIRFDMLDRPGTPCRMRAGATVVRVVQQGEGASGTVTVTYAKDGALHTVRGRTLIWSAASWTAKHAMEGLPDDYRAAMDSFPRSPMLSVNVALDNWRFLYDLGYSACSWRGGFGFTANIRPNMYVGDYRPPLDPDHPNLFTFYVPFNQHGLSLVDQGKVGRQKLLSTSYREFETQILKQMVTLFGASGFDPKRDVAGIVLNRWGHAYCNAGPGFYTPKNGKPTPADLLRQPWGRVNFGHSELNGNQHWPIAAAEGHRAAQKALEML